jgi:hypothetical protein
VAALANFDEHEMFSVVHDEIDLTEASVVVATD